MNSVLVTGGCGFVGRHIVRKCLDLGFHVEVVDNLSYGLRPASWMSSLRLSHDDHRRFKMVETDLRTFTLWQPIAGKYDLIFHCAAVVGGRLTIEHQPFSCAQDLAIDSDFFRWVSANPPRKVVYFSSSAVYPVELQTKESHVALAESMQSVEALRIGRPDMTYGFAKLAGEYLAHMAVKHHGLNVVIYRPFSGYGEDQDFAYPFPSIVHRVGSQQNPITVWGSGQQVRDFIHIDDVVEAVFETMIKVPAGSVLNLGTGIPTSMYKLAELAGRELNNSSSIMCDESKPEGVAYRVADTYQLSAFWRPKIGLEEGISRVHTYHQKALGLLDTVP